MSPTFHMMLHGLPLSVNASPSNSGALTFDFDGGSHLTIFLGSAEISADFEAAIKAVLEKHSAPAAAEQEAA